ncbi:50S ribosomal protein L6 [Candidatus Arcanobacter lacustris]|jgi:large subunit ribosomal protein L6|uniref:Large ribosomal subunit protein uL6 n=1 Tax=Candidatus Arcanibacter lacustris TaxID=1607817 RepID=A0A0F5MQU6_9RICK|nr:50S ribosomal protein L6 [Candidatus Arcanobacter lacustris]
MSRVGKLPIPLPTGTKVNITENNINVQGKLGELKLDYRNEVTVTQSDEKIFVKPANDSKIARAMWGLTRSLIFNMVKGVTEGFQARLEVNGVGYRCAVDGRILTMFLGYSHEIKYLIPESIEIKCEKPTLLVISGADKQKVGQVAALIRSLRKPEPYKGKGIKHEGEKIIRKEGKKK